MLFIDGIAAALFCTRSVSSAGILKKLVKRKPVEMKKQPVSEKGRAE